MDITFYSFSKKSNSTALPSSGGSTVSCTIRTGFDEIAPVIEYRGTPLLSSSSKNYAYIPYWGRYYYIRKKTFNAEENFWLFELECDVFATFRAQILESVQFVVRSSNPDYENTLVADLKAPTVGQTYKRVNSFGSGLLPTLASDFGACTVICNVAGTGFICMTGSNYNTMLNQFFVQHPITTNEYWTQDIARQLVDPASFFISQMALPIAAISEIYSGSFNPVCGWWTIDNVTAHRVGNTLLQYETTVGVPYHPQAGSDPSHYLNSPPYAYHSMYLGGFGQVALDSSKLTAGENLTVRLFVDVTSGGAKLKVINQYGQVAGYATAQMGFDLAMVSRNPINYIGIISNTLLGAGIGGVTGAIGGAARAVGELQGAGAAITQGSTGGFGGWSDFVNSRMMSEFKQVVKPSLSRVGRPVYDSYNLSAFTGYYVECEKPSISCKGTYEEKEKINNGLERGLYLE